MREIISLSRQVIVDPKSPIILEELVSGPNLESFLQGRTGKALERRSFFFILSSLELSDKQILSSLELNHTLFIALEPRVE